MSHWTDDAQTPMWNPIAAVAAWLLPGLGHYLLGERRRAVILAVTVGSVWLAGLLIGGIGVVNRVKHPAWFLGQMLVAPSVAVNFGRQFIDENHLMPVPDSPNPCDHAIYEPSFGHVYEQGILYTALAGLLNLLVIMDVVYRHPRHRRDGCAEAYQAARTGGSL